MRCREAKALTDPATYPSADLSHRPFLASRAARSQNRDAAQGFDDGNSRTNGAAAIVEGVVQRIDSGALRLCCEPVREVATDEPTTHWQQEKEPQALVAVGDAQEREVKADLSSQLQVLEAGQQLQAYVLGQLEAVSERHRCQPGHGANNETIQINPRTELNAQHLPCEQD